MNLACVAQGLRSNAEFLTVESQGVKRPQSISETLGARLTCSTAMRIVCLAWTVPGVALVWIGFASIGLRSVDDRDLSSSLDGVVAVSVLLAIFGCLIGLLWVLRTMDHIPAISRVGSGSLVTGLPGHLAAGVVAMAAGLLVTVGDRPHPVAVAVAVTAGFYTLLVVARWVLLTCVDPAAPLAALSVGIAYQLTIGWVHVLHPTGVLAPLLVVEGLALAWASLAAARVVAAMALAGVTPAPDIAAVDVAGDQSLGGLISQAPAQRSLPGPVVGR